jgi:N-acetylglucosamine malate deacetylase 1
MDKRVMALAAHPDDIEFMMSGTLFRLKELGWAIHYMTVANGSGGTTEHDAAEIIRIRRKESIEAAAYIGAEYHESLVNDFEVFYEDSLIRKIAAVIRGVGPSILLLPALEDYMEDHMNTARLGVTAAFTKGCPNYSTIPPVGAVNGDIVLYHAMPMGLADMLGRPAKAGLFVDVSGVMDKKKEMLSRHKSQQNWLSQSQGDNHYIETMQGMCRDMGTMAREYAFAEGWNRHNPLGFSRVAIDPLRQLLE